LTLRSLFPKYLVEGFRLHCSLRFLWVTVKNVQRLIPVDEELLREQANNVLKITGHDKYALGILLTTDARMRKLNLQYRGIDECTDVLSFSPHPVVVNEQLPTDSMFMGDLVMATRFIHIQCKEDGLDFQSHLTTLLAHGVCHLLGYDHEKDEDYEVL